MIHSHQFFPSISTTFKWKTNFRDNYLSHAISKLFRRATKTTMTDVSQSSGRVKSTKEVWPVDKDWTYQTHANKISAPTFSRHTLHPQMRFCGDFNTQFKAANSLPSVWDSSPVSTMGRDSKRSADINRLPSQRWQELPRYPEPNDPIIAYWRTLGA